MQTSASTSQLTKLYGDAFEIELPATFRDMADLVPVPDSQFVFQDMSTPG